MLLLHFGCVVGWLVGLGVMISFGYLLLYACLGVIAYV